MSDQKEMPSRGRGPIVQAVGLFAVTNIDDIFVLSLFFAQGVGQPGSATRVVLGQ
jgi:cadmium resistance protein CadD (predicted permease)